MAEMGQMAEKVDWMVTIKDEVEMIEKDEWVVTTKDALEQMDTIQTEEKKHWDKHCIYRVPVSFMDDKTTKAYQPQSVSFGPYHHGEDHLAQMEIHKQRALRHFLKRSKKPLESYLDSLAKVADPLKDSYDSLGLEWQTNTIKFLKMMIVDGCFMIEVLRYFTITEPYPDYAETDPIFSTHGKLHVMPYIRRDMLMLENQLPMLLLTMLLDDDIKGDEEHVNMLILKFYCPANTTFSSNSGMGKCCHLLDVYRKILVGKDSIKADPWNLGLKRFLKKSFGPHEASRMDTELGSDQVIRPAGEIKDAGVHFKKSKTMSLKDISFDPGNGKLRLPSIMVNDMTQSMFLNLIAFERFHVSVENVITSYIFFMDGLIDTAKDVRLLHEKGIIQNAIGSDEAAAELFNSIAKDTTLDPASSLQEVHMNIDEYCKKPWNRWRAHAKHTYFNNPWAIISVLAAAVLFAITILQTVYSLLDYYEK